MMPSGSAAVPAPDAHRLRIAEETGRIAVDLISHPRRPSEIMTAKAFENAVRVLLAIGGSTNAVIHLAAIAGRLGMRLDLERLNALSESTPLLVNLKPTGEHYMEHFAAAGGVPAVMRELRNLLHLDCMTVTGETLGERLERSREGAWIDRKVVQSASAPLDARGGLVALFGSLAPSGAILKRSAADPALFERRARCIVFTSPEDMARRIDDPDLAVSADDALVLTNAGPRSASAMPEAGYIPLPRKLASKGVKDMIRISDARMSGTAYGTVVLHVAPDAASGGPLSLVRTGDWIELSVARRRLDLLLPPAELEARRAQARPSASHSVRGYDWVHERFITQADEGCDFTFLRRTGVGAE
jgi:dihydroxy-acid dehydratase